MTLVRANLTAPTRPSPATRCVAFPPELHSLAVPTHTQVRRDPRLRSVQVLRCETITPQMRRIVFGGSELAGFQSDAPDDHVKLFFPNADGAFVLPTMTAEGPRYDAGAVPSPGRDYTPVSYTHLTLPTICSV